MTKPTQRRRSRKTKSRLPDLLNIGQGSIDAMKFRKLIGTNPSFNKLVKFEKALLAKPADDPSGLVRVAEICRHYTESTGMKLEDFLDYGTPDACVPRLILAVFEYAQKLSTKMAVAR